MKPKTAFFQIRDKALNDFQARKVLLSFEDYMNLVMDHPGRALRNSPQYIRDTLEYFGKTQIGNINGRPLYHFKLFDEVTDDRGVQLVGEDRAITELYYHLENFVGEGLSNKLLLLHGPNGSSKSTLLSILMKAMEVYSRADEGAIYTFNWLFPLEKKLAGGLGLGRDQRVEDSGVKSYADLPEELIAARVHCSMNDHPLLLIPVEYRKELLDEYDVGKNRILREGALGPKNRAIFQELFKAYHGDLEKVFKHVQVERMFLSEKESRGAITIEPKMYIDASARQITMDQNLSAIPNVLRGVDLFDMEGDLPKGNRGVVEFQDLLKRPLDTFRYLMNVCEEGKFSVGSLVADLDVIWLASTNDIELDAFKEFPDYGSFRARFEFVKVPYLLKVSQEKQIYDQKVAQIAGKKEVSPHTTWVAALWAVLTRMKKPNPKYYPSELGYAISNLTPLEKARLIDDESMPDSLSSEEQNYIKSNMHLLESEFRDIPYYEGRSGASPREIISILYEAAQNPEHACLSPLAILKAIGTFVQKRDHYEFLRQEPQGLYHQPEKYIEVVREEYIRIVEREVRSSLGLVEDEQYEDFLKRYVHHLRHHLNKEKVANPITGRFEDPDIRFIQEFEKKIDIRDAESFRQSVLSTIASWALAKQKTDAAEDELKINYTKVFPELIKKLENHYFSEQKELMNRLARALKSQGSKKLDESNDDHRLLIDTVQAMKDRFGYGEASAAEAINFLFSYRYHS